MKTENRILFLIYSINIPHKSAYFHKNLLVKNQNHGQKYGQKNIYQA